MTRDATNKAGIGDVTYDPSGYGEELAGCYDQLYPADGLETSAAIDLLAELAEAHGGRSILELGIGTGRLALDLHRRGLLVAGIDASPAMVAELRAKDPHAHIDIAVGDYLTTRLGGRFSVVAIVFNNILDRRGLSAQLALFANAAHHLMPGGFFVVESFVLSDAERDGHWTVAPRYVGSEHVELQMSRFDIETSTVERVLVHLKPGGSKFVTVRDVYSSPGELDVMAHVNGFERVARYATWNRDPFTSHSRRHVSVYGHGS